MSILELLLAWAAAVAAPLSVLGVWYWRAVRKRRKPEPVPDRPPASLDEMLDNRIAAEARLGRWW